MNLFEAIAHLETLTKTSDHPAREKILREKGLPIYEEAENPPPSENKPIDEEKVEDYYQMVALRHEIRQLEEWIHEDPFAFANVKGELEQKKVELKDLLEKWSPR